MAALALAAAAVAGCAVGGRFAARATGTQPFDATIPAGSDAVAVLVEMFNGPIEVRTGAAGRVHADVETTGVGATQAEAEADRAKIRVALDAGAGGAVVLRAVYQPDPESPNDRSASAVVEVPAGATLDLRTSNGRVTTTGVTAAVAVKTSNGEVRLGGLQAGATIHTSNGAVAVDGSGLFEIETSNGRIEVRGEEASARAHTSNGEVSFEGSFGDGAQVFETSNARITVRIPAGSAFTLDAATSNAKVDLRGFTLAAKEAPDEATLRGTVGTGGPSVILRTSNQAITVEAR